MTHLVRFTASCAAAVVLFSPLRAAEEAPRVVIERAPETDTSKQQQELAALRAENQRLAGELRDTQWAVGESKTRIEELEAAGKAASSATSVSAEKARADEANARMATLLAGVDKLTGEKATLESRLSSANKSADDLRAQLASAQHAAQPAAMSETAAKLAEAESKLAEAHRRNVVLQAESDLMKTASTDHARLNSEVQTLRQDKAVLEAKLRQLKPAETLTPTSDSADLASRLAQTEAKLATVLRSFSLLQDESDRFKAAATNQAQHMAEMETLRQEKAALEARIAANPTDQSHQIASRLADVENKLNTTLRSYTLLQRENDQLKADLAHTSESAHTSAEKSASEAASQTSALYDELRQTQANATSLAAENSQLKTRLALVGAPPGSTLSAPSRPGSAQAIAATTPAPAPETPAPPPEPRTHVVVLGDTLAKIAKQYYGSGGRWDDIMKANRDVVKNENVLVVGTKLRIP
ncbi:MAG: LysM peptidoglycan-binding domain-containing protein [Opitutus sp.]